MVIDPRAMNEGELENIRTYVYAPGTPFNPGADRPEAGDVEDPGIPRVEHHVRMSYGDFTRFTETTPAAGPAPALAKNPFLGPDPVRALDPTAAPDTTPPITISRNGRSRTGSLLLDTGAAASFLSSDMAAAVGVRYAPGTYGTDDARLIDAAGNTIPNQFSIPIGGVGGTINAAGFYLDALSLPTIEGSPIRFAGAPFLVLDVTVADPRTGQSLTLDGNFGMNYLVASAAIEGGFPTDVSAGAFDWITFDGPNGLLGLSPTGTGVANVRVNDGSAQRSMVRSLTVTFSEPVTLLNNALTLTRRDGAATGVTVAALNPSGDGQTYTLSLTGPGLPGNALRDGVYDLRINAAAVRNGSATIPAMTTDFTFGFHRLYADSDGDGDVDNADRFQLRSTAGKRVGQAGFKGYFDYEADGDVDNADLFQVRGRGRVTFKGY